MPTFADLWNANPPPDINLSKRAKIITICGPTDEVREIKDLNDREDEFGDWEMEDAEALTVVNDVRDVRQDWSHYRNAQTQEEDEWADAMNIDYESHSQGSDVVTMIVDTNILLSCLPQLEGIYNVLLKANATHRLELVVPGIVVQELDAQSKGARAHLQTPARNATHWLLSQIKRRRLGAPAIVRLQKDHETLLGENSWKITEANNDDLILDCCQYFARSTNKVYLLTNDLNLSLKTEAHDVTVLDRHNLKSGQDFVYKFVAPPDVLAAARDLGSMNKKPADVQLQGAAAQTNSERKRSRQRSISSTPSPIQRKRALPPEVETTSPSLPPKSRKPSKRGGPPKPAAAFVGSGKPAGRAPAVMSPTTSVPKTVTAGVAIEKPPDAPVSAKQPVPIEEEIKVEGDPTRSLEALHALFLQHLRTHLAGEVVSYLVDVPNPHANKSGRGRPPHSGPSLKDFESWTPQDAFKALEHAPPVKKPHTPIDWSCLFAFVALPRQSGYRANGGAPGDWRKAIFMLRLVYECYGIPCLGVEGLDLLTDMMECAAGLRLPPTS